MDYYQLKYFVQINKDKSFSKASLNLYTSRQALSRSMTQLESEMGVRLLIRNPEGVKLTDAGVKFLKWAQQQLGEFGGLISDLRGQNAGDKEKVSVCFEYGLEGVTLDALVQFQKEQPDIELTFRSMAYGDCIDAVLDNEMDMACVGEGFDTGVFDATLLMDSPLVCIMSKDNPLAKKEEIFIEDLRDVKFLMLSGRNPPATILNACRESGFEPSTIDVSPDPNIVRRLAESNMGIYYLPENLLHLYHSPDVAVKNFPGCPPLYLYLVTVKGKVLMPAAKKFSDFLVKATETSRSST